MKLIEILQKRGENPNLDKKEKEVCSWLKAQADDMITKASNHLEYVRNVLDEFDKHNKDHSEAVLGIIEELLGNSAENLSSYELFFLISAAYLHDCGMAVSDAEINVMSLVENDNHDGRKICTSEESLAIIKANESTIFPTEKSRAVVENWFFYPGDKESLFKYYSQLMRDYWEFRNGKIDVIQKSKNIEQTNKELRTIYIRNTHAIRAKKYIETWGKTRFADLLGNKAMGKRLADNIAAVCASHDENDVEIRKLPKNSMYIGKEKANLQFVSMMLRIGDIVHFSYDRAPSVLRALHNFQSDYSFNQWRIKDDNGINYSISDGEITYSAHCKYPRDYYDLMRYIDAIDDELQLYNRLKHEEKWGDDYPSIRVSKVNRDNIDHDESFTPEPNLRFKLEQNRILDLLMGTQLYSDEYACLRELYQNSLDACRCQMAIDKKNGKESKGLIEFGMGVDEEGNKYVYCLDNGKGMSKYIIENYLLRVGSSYYRSSDFFKEQAETGNTFTPTSQFGIGILSCFMIGNKIEITTREERGEILSCVMENLYECFYYKTPSDGDLERRICSSGTLIKIILNKKYKEKTNNSVIDSGNLDILLWMKSLIDARRLDEFEDWYSLEKELNESLKDNLYWIINKFVGMVPSGVELVIKTANNENLQIYTKPFPIRTEHIAALKETTNNNETIDTGVEIINNSINKAINAADNNVYIELSAEEDGMQCKSFLILPVKENGLQNYGYFPVIGRREFGGDLFVDGIAIDKVNDGVELPYIKIQNCFRNFNGSNRPQLSVSREKIIQYNNKENEEEVVNKLTNQLIKQAVEKTVQHINTYQIQEESDLYREIWSRLFLHYYGCLPLLITQHFNAEIIKDLLLPIPKSISSNRLSFGQFKEKDVTFYNYHLNQNQRYGDRFGDLIVSRIQLAKNYQMDGDNLIIKDSLAEKHEGKDKIYPIMTDFDIFKDYDIVSNLFPFVSCRSFSIDNISQRIEKLNHKNVHTDDPFEFCIWYLNRIFEKICDLTELDEPLLHALEKTIESNKTETTLMHDEESLSGFFNNNKAAFIQRFHNRDSHRLIGFDTPFNRSYGGVTIPNTAVTVLFSNELLKITGYDSTERIDNNWEKNELSVIFFGDEDFYVVPGRHSRQEIVDSVPDEVWQNLGGTQYSFLDGTPVKRKRSMNHI